jgi:hypothetical protein
VCSTGFGDESLNSSSLDRESGRLLPVVCFQGINPRNSESGSADRNQRTHSCQNTL